MDPELKKLLWEIGTALTAYGRPPNKPANEAPPKPEPQAAPKKEVSYEDVRRAALAYMQANGKPALKDLLMAKFGAKTAPDLPKEKWAEFLDAAAAKEKP